MNDQEISARFAELRAHELKQTPSFEIPRSRSGSRSRSRGGLRVAGAWRVVSAGRVVGAGLAAAALAVLFIANRGDKPPEMSITEWQAPTDVLLQMPGTEWLAEMPTLNYEGTP